MRVSTLPRIGTGRRPRPSASSWAIAPRRAGADRRTRGQLAEHPAVAGDQRVARVLPRRDRGDHEPRVRRRREVLVGVHGEVDLVGHERVAQLRDEHADAERGDRGGRAVAGGADGDQLDGVAGGAQPLRDEFGLGDGQRAGPGAEAERTAGSAVTGVPRERRRRDRAVRVRRVRHLADAPCIGASSAASTSPWRCTATAAGVCGSSSNSSRRACGVAAAVRPLGQPLDLHRRGVQQLVDDAADGCGRTPRAPAGPGRAAARRAAAARASTTSDARRRSAVTVGVTSAERCAAR